MTNKIIEIEVDEENIRVDKYLSDKLEFLTRSNIQKLISEGLITLDGKKISKNRKLLFGENITISIPEPKDFNIKAEDIPLDIPYEDDDLLVVNKPKGMVVHPAPGNYEGTLVNALMYHCKDSLSGINGVLRPGIVHRIDKDTSGLLIVAKNDNSHIKLAEQIKEHSFLRKYRAVVYGSFKNDTGDVNAPIGRNPSDRKKMAVILDNKVKSREAITHYKVVNRYEIFSGLSLQLETGRTHQIRVHMAYINHPVAGDPVYGPKKVISSLKGQCLHAGLIGFIHPRTGKYIEIESDLPEYFKYFISKLKEI